MSSIATSPRHRAASSPRRSRSSPQARQTRRSRRLDRKRRRRQTRKARAARRKLQLIHQQLPQPARSLFDAFAGAFTRPTFLRFLVFSLASLLTIGRRTVCNLLRTLGRWHLAIPPATTASSAAPLVLLAAGHGLAGWVFDHLVPEGRVFLAGDDTVDEHPGDKVFGKGCHRDPVRSTHSFTAFRWGHKWVVLSVLVRFPYATALGVAVAGGAVSQREGQPKAGRRHKTPARLLRQLCCLLLRWFRQRPFVLSGDGNYGSHELARFASRRRGRLILVSKFYPDAKLYEPPPRTPGTTGRASRGQVAHAGAGGGRSEAYRTERGLVRGGPARCRDRQRHGPLVQGRKGLVAVRWVFVHDLTGTHRDEYFFTTDVGMSAQEVIETYVGRWNEETTFQEMRSYLGLETTRGWKEKTVLRVAPCLFGLYTLVACLYSQLPKRYARVRAVDWAGKQEVTFSDAITAVRRWLWVEWVFAIPGYREPFQKLSRPFRCLLLHALLPLLDPQNMGRSRTQSPTCWPAAAPAGPRRGREIGPARAAARTLRKGREAAPAPGNPARWRSPLARVQGPSTGACRSAGEWPS